MNTSPALLAAMARKRAPDPAIVAAYEKGGLASPLCHAAAPTGLATVVTLAVKIGGAIRGKQLDVIASETYAAVAAGALGDVEASLLDAARARRRDEQRNKRQWWQRAYGLPAPRPRDLLKARARRRGLVRLGWLPPDVANLLTPGEEAVAAIYAQDFRRKGGCDDSKAQLAERAGVVERVVQRAQRTLKAAGVISVLARPRKRMRHETTLIEIIDPIWKLWLRDRRVRAKDHRGVGDCEGDRPVRAQLPDDVEADAAKKRGHPSKEAIAFADELAIIAGHKVGQLPKSWTEADPPRVVEGMLIDLCRHMPWQQQPLHMLRRLVVQIANKRASVGDPPQSPRYFATALKRVCGETQRALARPLPAGRRV